MKRCLAVVLVVLGLTSPVFAGAPLPPNELGRVMILEYHKIDHPEHSTPESSLPRQPPNVGDSS